MQSSLASHSHGPFHGPFHNGPPLNPIEPPMLPVQYQQVNPGVSTSCMLHHPTGPFHSYIQPALGGHVHGYIPPALGGHSHESYATTLANAPSLLLQTTTTTVTAQHDIKSQNTSCESSRRNLSPPLKGRSSTKRKQLSHATTGRKIATPLTPYNFFFRVERNRLLQQVSCATGETVAEPNVALQEFYAGVLRNQDAFIEQVLQDQWSRDPSQKRKHQKVHGKISFESMSRRIAASWQALPDSVKNVFRQISDCDHRRYDEEVRNTAFS
jgi:hypothetical protein